MDVSRNKFSNAMCVLFTGGLLVLFCVCVGRKFGIGNIVSRMIITGVYCGVVVGLAFVLNRFVKKMIENNRRLDPDKAYIIGIVAASVLLVIIRLLIISDVIKVQFNTGAVYEMAKIGSDGKIFADVSTIDKLFATILSVMFKVFGNKYFPVYLTQTLLTIAAYAMIVWSVKCIFGRFSSAVSAFGIAVFPIFFRNIANVSSDCLILFFFGFILLISAIYKNNIEETNVKPVFSVLLGALTGLLALYSTVFMFVILIPVIILWNCNTEMIGSRVLNTFCLVVGHIFTFGTALILSAYLYDKNGVLGFVDELMKHISYRFGFKFSTGFILRLGDERGIFVLLILCVFYCVMFWRNEDDTAHIVIPYCIFLALQILFINASNKPAYIMIFALCLLIIGGCGLYGLGSTDTPVRVYKIEDDMPPAVISSIDDKPVSVAAARIAFEEQAKAVSQTTVQKPTEPEKKEDVTAKTVSQTKEESASEVASQTVAESVSETASQTVAEIVSEIALQTKAEGISEVASQTVAESVSEIASQTKVEERLENVTEIADEKKTSSYPEIKDVMGAEESDKSEVNSMVVGEKQGSFDAADLADSKYENSELQQKDDTSSYINTERKYNTAEVRQSTDFGMNDVDFESLFSGNTVPPKSVADTIFEDEPVKEDVTDDSEDITEKENKEIDITADAVTDGGEDVRNDNSKDKKAYVDSFFGYLYNGTEQSNEDTQETEPQKDKYVSHASNFADLDLDLGIDAFDNLNTLSEDVKVEEKAENNEADKEVISGDLKKTADVLEERAENNISVGTDIGAVTSDAGSIGSERSTGTVVSAIEEPKKADTVSAQANMSVSAAAKTDNDLLKNDQWDAFSIEENSQEPRKEIENIESEFVFDFADTNRPDKKGWEPIRENDTSKNDELEVFKALEEVDGLTKTDDQPDAVLIDEEFEGSENEFSYEEMLDKKIDEDENFSYEDTLKNKIENEELEKEIGFSYEEALERKLDVERSIEEAKNKHAFSYEDALSEKIVAEESLLEAQKLGDISFVNTVEQKMTVEDGIRDNLEDTGFSFQEAIEQKLDVEKTIENAEKEKALAEFEGEELITDKDFDFSGKNVDDTFEFDDSQHEEALEDNADVFLFNEENDVSENENVIEENSGTVAEEFAFEEKTESVIEDTASEEKNEGVIEEFAFDDNAGNDMNPGAAVNEGTVDLSDADDKQQHNIDKPQDDIDKLAQAALDEIITDQNKAVNDQKDIIENVGDNDKPAKEKVEFIENPLPLPKKHVHREMDYGRSIPEAWMHYDIELDSKNNHYDI